MLEGNSRVELRELEAQCGRFNEAIALLRKEGPAILESRIKVSSADVRLLSIMASGSLSATPQRDIPANYVHVGGLHVHPTLYKTVEDSRRVRCIEDGSVDYPERMAFMYWQKWRKDTASRPTKKKDGRSTTLQQENKVWRETMEFLYDDFDAETEEEYEEEEEEEVVEPRHTPAGKGRVAERSGPPSSAGTGGPVSADSLQAELRELYRPDQVFLGDLEKLTSKATILSEEYAKDRDEIEKEIACLGELILALGGKTSSDPGKEHDLAGRIQHSSLDIPHG
ncbi:hypothetical protein AK812_SmicGene39751 [Symbiodinium microadriaticum]|uniref:Uncharacterized protein n=1 Tax=Symbiodinium microadriaticum TaxID=2951 RepID=A0A1Q9CAD7_SYMMI|nr:hypothetical protein AK812_SmicGene39751 [Symbiodinium microadriaticum]